GTTTILDTDQLVGGQSRKGVWNFTTVSIPPTSTVRIIGPYIAHMRCTGTFFLGGALSVVPGQSSPPLMNTPPYDRGPDQGVANNGAGVNCEAEGGAANAGGGRGGTGAGTHMA